MTSQVIFNNMIIFAFPRVLNSFYFKVNSVVYCSCGNNISKSKLKIINMDLAHVYVDFPEKS